MLEDVEEDYQLLAIHSSLEEYKLAYFLNKQLGINMSRARVDLDFNHGPVQAIYPLYVFKEPAQYRNYYLIKNKYKGPVKKIISSGSLFIEEEVTPQLTYLIPEYKEVDFFFKIEEDPDPAKLLGYLNKIIQIPDIVTVYSVNADMLKSKKNLILE